MAAYSNNSYQILDKGQIYKTINGEQITYWDLLEKTFVIPDNFTYSVYIVEKDYIARPDLIALALYGSDQLADYICKLNGISNPFDLNVGKVLIIPALTELQKFRYTGNDKSNTLVGQDDTTTSTSTINDAKSISDKTRQPNTAIINQPNFTINKKKRTIIY